MKQKLKSGDEVDAVCSRQWYHWKPNQIRKIKRALNKRVRKDGKQEIREQTDVKS